MISKALILSALSFSFPFASYPPVTDPVEFLRIPYQAGSLSDDQMDERELADETVTSVFTSKVAAAGLAVKIFFSPKGGTEDAIVGLIDSANVKVVFMAYSFTSKPISQALVRAVKRLGPNSVAGVFDRSHDKNRDIVSLLASQGVNVYIDFEHAIMHNKFMDIDEEVLETGSYNYSFSAENKNAENVLILYNKVIATEYNKNFILHMNHSKRFTVN